MDLRARLSYTPPEYSPRSESGEDNFLCRTDSEHKGNRSLPLCSFSSEPNTSYSSYDSDDDHLLPLSPAVRRGGETPFREREFPQLRTTRRQPPICPGHEARRPRQEREANLRPSRFYTQAKLQFTPHPQLASTPIEASKSRPQPYTCSFT